ncbi:unnamed protein product, partial [Diamesa serratosioi]
HKTIRRQAKNIYICGFFFLLFCFFRVLFLVTILKKNEKRNINNIAIVHKRQTKQWLNDKK